MKGANKKKNSKSKRPLRRVITRWPGSFTRAFKETYIKRNDDDKKRHQHRTERELNQEVSIKGARVTKFCCVCVWMCVCVQ